MTVKPNSDQESTIKDVLEAMGTMETRIVAQMHSMERRLKSEDAR